MVPTGGAKAGEEEEVVRSTFCLPAVASWFTFSMASFIRACPAVAPLLIAAPSAFASFTMQSWYDCSCFCHSLIVPMLLLKASALLESMMGAGGIAPHPAGAHPSGPRTPARAVNAVVQANDAATKMVSLIAKLPLGGFNH
jgi:hypothetical protein